MVVAELGTRIAAGTCGTLLAQLGATVIVAEPRNTSLEGKWVDRAATMAGKRSIAVDHSSSVDRALLEKLVDAADIVLLSTDVPGLETAGKRRWTSPRPPKQ